MYFLQTPCNEWDLKKASIAYLKNHDASVVKELMKKDLILLKNSANCGKKLKSKADQYIQMLDKTHHKDIQKYANKDASTSSSGTNNVNIRTNIGNVNVSNVFNNTNPDGIHNGQDNITKNQASKRSSTHTENTSENQNKSHSELPSALENIEEQKEDTVNQSEDINYLIPFVATEKASAADFRELIFKAGYEYFKGNLSLQTIQELNIMKEQLNPSNLAESLDLLAYSIINIRQSAESDHVLKISLSRILFLVGGITLKIYKELFHDQCLFNELLKKKPTMEPGLSNIMAKCFDEVVERSKHGINKTREYLMEKRLEVLKNNGNETEEMELLDILDFVVSNFDYQAKKKKKSELTHYRYAASILDIIFRNQDFGLNDGESCSKATREARIANMKACNDTDDKKSVIGRKIDLILVSMSLEVSCSEWKKANTSPALVDQQQIKNCRTNSSILHDLKKLPIPEKEKEDMFVLGMEWIGDIGFMVSVKEFEGAHLVHHVGDLCLPHSLTTLEDFQNTLELLYSYKHHYMKMKDILEVAQHRYTVQQNLSRYRFLEDEPQQTDEELKTFFTPVKRQKTIHSLVTCLEVDEDN